MIRDIGAARRTGRRILASVRRHGSSAWRTRRSGKEIGHAQIERQHERVLDLFTGMRQRLGFGQGQDQGQGAAPVEEQDKESEDR